MRRDQQRECALAALGVPRCLLLIAALGGWSASGAAQPAPTPTPMPLPPAMTLRVVISGFAVLTNSDASLRADFPRLSDVKDCGESGDVLTIPRHQPQYSFTPNDPRSFKMLGTGPGLVPLTFTPKMQSYDKGRDLLLLPFTFVYGVQPAPQKLSQDKVTSVVINAGKATVADEDKWTSGISGCAVGNCGGRWARQLTINVLLSNGTVTLGSGPGESHDCSNGCLLELTSMSMGMNPDVSNHLDLYNSLLNKPLLFSCPVPWELRSDRIVNGVRAVELIVPTFPRCIPPMLKQ
jgi:hypothetical protein